MTTRKKTREFLRSIGLDPNDVIVRGANGEEQVLIKPVCDALGLDYEQELSRIQESGLRFGPIATH